MVYNYTYSKHNETLLDGLSAQRQNQSHFCDITIKTRDDLQNEVVIFGHKCVLATTSEHLNSIINMEENQQHNLEYDMSTIADAGKFPHPAMLCVDQTDPRWIVRMGPLRNLEKSASKHWLNFLIPAN